MCRTSNISEPLLHCKHLHLSHGLRFHGDFYKQEACGFAFVSSHFLNVLSYCIFSIYAFLIDSYVSYFLYMHIYRKIHELNTALLRNVSMVLLDESLPVPSTLSEG